MRVTLLKASITIPLKHSITAYQRYIVVPSKNIGKRIADVKIGQMKVLIKFEGEDKALEILPNTFTEFKLFNISGK